MSINRRRFLAWNATAGAAGLPGRPSAAAERSNGGATPLPRLLPGCCAYSYGRYLANGRMTMEDFIRTGVRLGLSGVDMTVYWFKSTEPAYLDSLRHSAYQNAMPFSGAACGANMTLAGKAERAAALEQIKKWVDVTDRLGAPHLRVFAGKAPAGASMAQAIGWTVEVMKPACEYSGRRGIMLGIENHSGVTQRADTLLDIIRQSDSPYAGVNLDISNFATQSDEEQYREIEACIPYTTHVHVRDHFESNHHPIDLDRVWRLFARHGHKGFLSAEYEAKEDPITGTAKLVNEIKTLCRKYSSV